MATITQRVTQSLAALGITGAAQVAPLFAELRDIVFVRVTRRAVRRMMDQAKAGGDAPLIRPATIRASSSR